MPSCSWWNFRAIRLRTSREPIGFSDYRIAALRSAETATVLANYLRILGYDACSHSATTSDVNLGKLAVSAGLAITDNAGCPVNPFLGRQFGLAAVTTTLELACDLPLRSQTIADRLRSKG